MDWKKICNKLLYPPIWLMIVLVPVATVLVVSSMVLLATDSPIAIASYVLAAYTLTVWCVKIPYLIDFFKTLKNENVYVRRWLDDTRLRVNVLLYGTLIWNVIYSLLQLVLGFIHASFWYYSMAFYYVSLAFMRFFLVRYTSKNKLGESVEIELRKYRICGWVFLFMNLAVSLMIFFMVYWNRTFIHHEITTIALAAYTFTAFTIAIVNIVKYRKYKSPVYSASKMINLAAACVSVLTLEATMLTTFGSETVDEITRKLMLGLSGGAISVAIILMAIYMIMESSKKINLLSNEDKTNAK